MTTEALPTIKEELDRKVTDILIELEQARAGGLRPPQEIAAAATAIWFAVSGLVDKTVLDLATQLTKAADTGRMFRHYVGHGKVVTIAWSANAPGGYVVMYRDATSNTVSRRSFPTEVGFRDTEIASLGGKLTAAGYVQLP